MISGILGHYQITSQIGKGGMGEVYRARDTKLGREVAIKVLPEEFARDAERMARFQREAKLLAALNHTNIATLHGIEDSENAHALVMELAEGPTLADLIAHGPIPIEETIPIARQMADALEYAHEHGIIHRDLKPANVKVAPDDTVKILDFGLAKAMEPESLSAEQANSPTLSHLATQAGVLLGTAAYMAPEQAKGKVVDRRADIWAFGCVLFEMLTGKSAFHSETMTETLAAVIKNEPDWSLLPEVTPIRVRVLLQRCMQKDPKQRLRDMGDARISLDEVLSGAPDGGPSPGAAVPVWRRALPWAAGMFIGALITGLLVWKLAAPASLPAAQVRFQISLPQQRVGTFSLSPDGRQLAFVDLATDGRGEIWVRSLDSLEARPLAGTESTGLQSLFWSPDSRFLAFTSIRSGAGGEGDLKRVAVSGGAAEKICSFTGNSNGGSWSSDGLIICAIDRGLMKVSATGGVGQPLTIAAGVEQHGYPQFLPDGRHFLYSRVGAGDKSGIYIGSLDSKPEEQDSNRLLNTQSAVFVPSSDRSTGYLLFVSGGSVMAQAFDARRGALSGEAAAVAEQIGDSSVGSVRFTASANGVLAYRSETPTLTKLIWVDRQGGRVQGSASASSANNAVSLSPDGKLALVSNTTLSSRLWLVDFAQGRTTPFTFPSSPAGGVGGDPVWSPDSSRVIFTASVGGVYSSLYEKPVSGATDEVPILKSPGVKHSRSWSPDGRFLLYDGFDPKTGRSAIWALPLKGDKTPIPIIQGEFNVGSGQISPGGHWMAYGSDEFGQPEVFVRAFSLGNRGKDSAAGGPWQISAGGGTDPRWRGDGRELYYRAFDGKVMAVEVAANPTFQPGPPRELFPGPPMLYRPGASMPSGYGVSADGNRFLFQEMTEPTGQSSVTIVLNCLGELNQQVPAN
jgi:Tol biopolymer transport system component